MWWIEVLHFGYLSWVSVLPFTCRKIISSLNFDLSQEHRDSGLLKESCKHFTTEIEKFNLYVPLIECDGEEDQRLLSFRSLINMSDEITYCRWISQSDTNFKVAPTKLFFYLQNCKLFFQIPYIICWNQHPIRSSGQKHDR